MYCNFHVITDLNIDIYIVLLFKDLIGRNSNFIVLDMYFIFHSYAFVVFIFRFSVPNIFFELQQNDNLSDLYSTYMYCESFLGFLSSTH